MRRDSIFYKLFKQFPSLLFELVDTPPTAAANYQFESIEVKETAFRIDGVFLPPNDADDQQVYFAEVQFQKDEDLYFRFFSELSLFLHRHPIRYDDWSGVIIFGSRNLEPSNLRIHRSLLSGGQIQRVYLDELGDVQQQPLGLGLMLLTIKEGTEAIDTARFLLAQAQTQSETGIIDLITTIIVYKFSNLTRKEIITMLGLDLEEPRAIREAKEEGREEGRKQEAISLVIRLLNRRLDGISQQCCSQIQLLSLSQIETLGEDLLDFVAVADLEKWLQSH
ncbi:Rpn family recombination-promoting nuclease/putative transposase [Dolichospermum circinale]|uniref:Rpn family recombination-promoting nuclease/putative transposase n=1 Tax=Dolichospermum circinale TaxID=109265 RepID=UPI002330AEE0|nr:Rpn family recombination-promoting nuclease/putative transposase [Dolichospermum circinale]MDB9466595.1 Rpn family recombination-promoting nuclease/putative transposase [Dolichospermum circinale CS-539/09]MDB9470475.1 Rpn family recombination-promoting nuclease/putative transposase [Dolichospermum circinale CS-539]